MIKILGLTFHLYGLLIGLAVWLALEVSLYIGKLLRVNRKVIEEAFLWVVIPGIIGARMYHVVDLWQKIYSDNIWKILYLWEGGLGIFGGILGGIVGLFVYWKTRKTKTTLLRLLDVTIIGVPLAQAVGRWGNFANGELYGKPTLLPWGIKVNDSILRVHPLFLYESLLDLALFVGLFLFVKSKKEKTKRGSVLGTYLIGYGLIRFFLETLRPSEVIWTWMGIPMAQIWAIFALIAGIYFLSRTRGRT